MTIRQRPLKVTAPLCRDEPHDGVRMVTETTRRLSPAEVTFPRSLARRRLAGRFALHHALDRVRIEWPPKLVDVACLQRGADAAQ